MILLIIIIILLYIVYKPYLDIFKDKNGKYHILLWYNSIDERKYIIILGGSQ